MKALVLVFAVISSSAHSKERCAKSLVRTYVDGQPRVETTRLCLDDETRPGAPPDPGFLISEKCLMKKCRAMTASREISRSIGEGKMDRFAKRFTMCKNSGGRPEVIEFQWDGRFQPSDRCVFADHSFVDTMSLVGFGRFAAEAFVTQPRANRTAPAAGAAGRDRKR